ncbi:Mpo1 family 2-hydroxy fatty acid dioxygenase [Yunchengibacter salinarum]|uniref:Mpo1 family 2-hydroxy fatty acid dioxygenase n=1 Tax=Yunchengibacter salinarum TaxID=3133399 RepID=UPI0035B6A856
MRGWFYEQMAMYSAYHRSFRNQLTHHVGVPLIVFSLLVIAARVELMSLPGGPLTLAAALMGLLLLIYVVAVPLIGMVAVALYGVLLYAAQQVAALGLQPALIVFGAGFVGGWVIQFIGHAFEGRRPALFDNLVQIFMAPAFLIAEILFALGVEQGLRAEIGRRMPRYLPKDD